MYGDKPGFWENVLFAIEGKEGFYIRCVLAIPSAIYFGGFFATVFPSMAGGIQILLGIGTICTCLWFIAKAGSRRHYGGIYGHLSFWHVILMLLPAIALASVIWMVYGFGVFAAL